MTKGIRKFGSLMYGICPTKDGSQEVVIYKTLMKEGSLEIPDEIEGFPVTSIRELAFKDRVGLTSVQIPSSVKYIGDEAFCGCSGLTEVIIPEGVELIEWHAFSGCLNLSRVTIPATVNEIGECAFCGCKKMMDFYVAADNPKYKSESGLLLSKDGKVLLSVPGGRTNVIIPASVVKIGVGAFALCSGLKDVTIPVGVTYIGDIAFYDCSGLTNITIPLGVTHIGVSAFAGCSDLVKVSIPSTVTHIGKFAFSGCKSLKNHALPMRVEDQSNQDDENFCFGHSDEVDVGEVTTPSEGFVIMGDSEDNDADSGCTVARSFHIKANKSSGDPEDENREKDLDIGLYVDDEKIEWTVKRRVRSSSPTSPINGTYEEKMFGYLKELVGTILPDEIGALTDFLSDAIDSLERDGWWLSDDKLQQLQEEITQCQKSQTLIAQEEKDDDVERTE